MTVEQLQWLVKDLRDSDVVELVKEGNYSPVDSTVEVMLGVRGHVVRHSPKGAVVRCSVQKIRHVLRMVAA